MHDQDRLKRNREVVMNSIWLTQRRTYWVAANAVALGFLVWFAIRFGDFHRLPPASPDEFAGFSVMPLAYLPVAGLALVVNLFALIFVLCSKRPQAKRATLKLFAGLSAGWVLVTALCIAGI